MKEVILAEIVQIPSMVTRDHPVHTDAAGLEVAMVVEEADQEIGDQDPGEEDTKTHTHTKIVTFLDIGGIESYCKMLFTYILILSVRKFLLDLYFSIILFVKLLLKINEWFKLSN